MNQSKVTILCTGGATGYLASFIAEAVDKYNDKNTTSQINYLPTSRNILSENKTSSHKSFSDNKTITFRYDTSEEIFKASQKIKELKPNVIVHTAAMSTLAPCERDPKAAMEANCPEGLLDAIDLAEKDGNDWHLKLFIYISTDQVYPGDEDSKGRVLVPCQTSLKRKTIGSNPTRTDEKVIEPNDELLWPPILPQNLPPPVNVYAKSKLAFESILLKRRGGDSRKKGNCIILRSSNMFGPVSPITGQGRFLQWLDSSLSISPEAEKIGLFADEYRNFVYVRDVANAILQISLSSTSTSSQEMQVRMQHVYNMGGPLNLSRIDFGRWISLVKKYPFEETNIVSENRADLVGASYQSPLNIGMDSRAIEQDFPGFKFTSMEVALSKSLGI